MKSKSSDQTRAGFAPEVAVLLTAVILIALYTTARYGGLWGESDTAVFTRIIRAVIDTGSLVSPRGAYSNGYGFPALGAFLAHITGLSVAQLQIFGGPLLVVWIVLPAWLAYRELTGSARGATLATVFVLIQPELMFALLRGTHEKFTRGLMFLAFYLLVRGLMTRRRWRRFASLLLAFYLVIFALITFNNLMSISFITALGLALVLNLAARRLAGSQNDDTTATNQRLLYAVMISIILAFFFTFYAYPPARHAIFLLQSTADRMAMLFLDAQEVAVNPYATIGGAWTSPTIYLMITIANWLLLGLSFILWVSQTFDWWRRRAWPEEPRALLLWSLYGAFGFLGAVSIIVDVSGAIATNLQHRIFPSFAMIAAPLVAEWLISRQAAQPEGRQPARAALLYGALASAIAFLGIVAVIKATNEPAVGNKWSYYSTAEFTGLEWARQYNPDTVTKAAFDERLSAAMLICCGLEDEIKGFYTSFSGRVYLVSDIIRARGERLGLPLPIDADNLRVYDNGAAEVYRLRPRTPFQE